MDRDDVLKILNSSDSIAQKLYNYCIQSGKSPELTVVFIQLCQLQNLFNVCLLDIYAKYNIVILSDIQGRIIFKYF